MPYTKTVATDKPYDKDLTQQNQCTPKSLSCEKSRINDSPTLTKTCTTLCQTSAGNNTPLNLSRNANVDQKLSFLATEADNETESDSGRGVDNYSPSIYDQFNTKKCSGK